jgi:hypothetical protein
MIFSLDLDSSENLKPSFKIHLTLIYLLICFLIYFNMFGLMTYNGYIIIAVILGNAFGYYIFGVSKKSMVRIASNVGCCHSG